MTEEANTIYCKDVEWVEAEVEGNNLCPKCKEPLLLIPLWDRGLGFCMNCKKHWVTKYQPQIEGVNK